MQLTPACFLAARVSWTEFLEGKEKASEKDENAGLFLPFFTKFINLSQRIPKN